MGEFRKVRVEDLPDGLTPASEKKEVDEAVGATAFGFNVYGAAPGEQLPWGRHRHPDHEELFYVLAGELTVETADGEFVVGADEALFVPPDRYNRAVASGESYTRVVAVGAPKGTDRAIIEEACADCGTETRQDASVETVTDGSEEYREVVLQCVDCGAETRRFRGGSRAR